MSFLSLVLERLVEIMKRKFFQSGDLRLSYLESGEAGMPLLVCLHGHFGYARYFANLMEVLPKWQVVSLDQRGHGWSDHAKAGEYGRDEYLADLHRLIVDELGAESVVLLGHSMGGLNAYQFAARYPELVKAVILEDMGAEEDSDAGFILGLKDHCSTFEALQWELHNFGMDDTRYFDESAVEDDLGWTYRFDRANLPESQAKLNGDWWDDFLGSTCPMLLLHGRNSFCTNADLMEKMAELRENTELEIFEDCGHTMNLEQPNKYLKSVKKFLASLAE